MEMLNPSYIKEVVRKTRISRNETQEEFARHFNVGKNSVWQWEQGKNFPDDLLLPKLSELSGVPVDDLLYAKRAINLIQDGIDLHQFFQYLSSNLQAA